jgi:polyribonucleotide nucleotidyltransferase
MADTVRAPYGDEELIIETGKLAKQASGAVTVQYGGTMILATAVVAPEPSPRSWLPLFVEYREKTYAAGKIPGGFFRREGRPSEREVLIARMIDRPIRPLFPAHYRNEVQIIVSVLSADQENEIDVPSMIGASAALMISEIPFGRPLGAVRVGYVDGEFLLNPTYSRLEESELDIVVSGMRDGVVMLCGTAKEASEELMADAVRFGQEALQTSIDLQKDLVSMVGKVKLEVPPVEVDSGLKEAVIELMEADINRILFAPVKAERVEITRNLLHSIVERLQEEYPEREQDIRSLFDKEVERRFREAVIKEKRRADNRGLNEVRPITCEVGMLPRAHGSALFSRGETQALVAATLGTSRDKQKLDELTGESFKRFMLHYNFPPFSVGEVKPIRGPGRREIGHGALAESALEGITPSEEEFPYTIRLVSDILESNGSSSMAAVCGGMMALLDAGVPVKELIAGVSIGLIQEEDESLLLTDIMGLEDYYGDMDFKVAGTVKGITAWQMDMKIPGVSPDLVWRALVQAKDARLEILEKMKATLAEPREDISIYAPRITQIKVDPEKIREIIGPGGKVIRNITATTGAEIEVEDDGTVTIAAVESEAARKAIEMIEAITADVEVGTLYDGTVMRIVNFGAFVEILPGKEGLVRISEIANERIDKVEDVLKEGDVIKVKCIEVDSMNRINLSKLEADIELGLVERRTRRDTRDSGDKKSYRPRQSGDNRGGGGGRPPRRGGRDRR